jgi:hypothetical protein
VVEGITVTPEPTGTALKAPEVPQGLSEPTRDLPEEFKPYSDLPWEQIPEDVRTEVLKGIKKFHGGMTKHQQEYKRLQQELPELQERSAMLEKLVNEPWVREAYEAHQKGLKPNEPQPSLTEQFDPEQATALERIIEQKVQERLNPVSSQLTSLQQQQLNAQTKGDLERLSAEAKAKGWPDPYDRMNDLYAQVTSGAARSVEEAYKLSVFDELPDLIRTQAQKATMTELQQKASQTVSPIASPGGTPSQQSFKGRNAVADALAASIKELAGR